MLCLHLFLPAESLGPAQLAVEALDDGFVAPVLDLETHMQHSVCLVFTEGTTGIQFMIAGFKS